MPFLSPHTDRANGSIDGSLVDDLMLRLGWADAERAEKLLRITLRGIRDRLPDAEFACLLRRVPPLLRVASSTGPRSKRYMPRRHDDAAHFVAQMRETSCDRIDITPETVSAVFAVLAEYVLLGEENNSCERLARHLLALWPTDR